MINRIDLFMPPLSQYGVLHYLTKELFEAFLRQGVNCRLLVAQKDNPQPFLESIFSDPPDCTLSLNGLLPDEKGNFFCNMIKTPHVACLVGSPNQYFGLTQSPLNIITCPDVFSCHFFRGLNFENVLFMTHGAEKTLEPDPTRKRKYDVVMLASCIDYESIRDSWEEKYPKALCTIIDDAAERAFSNRTISYVEALVGAVNEQAGKKDAIDPSSINLIEILDQLEVYLRGKDRVKLVRSIKDAKVEVFGAGMGTAHWSTFLGDKYPNITLHDPVPYEEALNIMKQSKIFLSSCPTIKYGGHESSFAAMACEALLITTENVFMKEHFKEGEEILFYHPKHWDKVNDLVNTYLADENKRETVAKKGREKVMSAHTWDHRVATLLEQLPPILEKVKNTMKSATPQSKL